MTGSSDQYRADIDGLRAVAVLLVIAFHAFPNQVNGGFVGVDVFFVISGFLISGIIADDLARGRFSFLEFYARRARRLFPALAIVLTACLVAGLVLLFPIDLRDLGEQVVASTLFVQNFVLWQDADYFDTASELKPLLHVWSLAVEEQFYLLWPLLFWLAWRAGLPLLWLASGIFTASFLCNVWLVQSSPVAAFYLPMTRFWELMAGAMLAIAVRRHGEPVPYAYRNAMAWGGVALLVLAVGLIKEGSLFPGAWALLPVGGTFLLIAAGPSTWIARTLLQQRLLVGIGLISYPLYLWHWPILAFARNVQLKEPTSLLKIGYILASFGLAYATWRWIEKPVRSGALRLRTAAIASAALLLCGVVGLLVFAADGLASRFPAEVHALGRDLETETNTSVRLGTCFLSDIGTTTFDPSCDGNGLPSASRIALWGDSYGASIYPGLHMLKNEVAGIDVAQYTISGCPPIIGFKSAQRNCAPAADVIVERLKQVKPDTIVLAARWNLYDGREGWGRVDDSSVAATIATLKNIGIRRIVIVGQFPVWIAHAPKILAHHYRAARTQGDIRDMKHLNALAFPADEWIKAQAAALGTTFVSPFRTFCDNSGCLLAVPSSGGQPTAWDQGHLTVAASEYFARLNKSALIGE